MKNLILSFFENQNHGFWKSKFWCRKFWEVQHFDFRFSKIWILIKKFQTYILNLPNFEIPQLFRYWTDFGNFGCSRKLWISTFPLPYLFSDPLRTTSSKVVKRCEENVKRSLHILFTSLHMRGSQIVIYLEILSIKVFYFCRFGFYVKFCFDIAGRDTHHKHLDSVLTSDLGIAEVGLHLCSSIVLVVSKFIAGIFVLSKIINDFWWVCRPYSGQVHFKDCFKRSRWYILFIFDILIWNFE